MNKEELIENVFKKYQDPEIGIDVWTLGLIYDINVSGEEVKVVMTFTTPFCPYGPQMVDELKEMIEDEGFDKVEVEVTFDPPWKPSEELREMLGV